MILGFFICQRVFKASAKTNSFDDSAQDLERKEELKRGLQFSYSASKILLRKFL